MLKNLFKGKYKYCKFQLKLVFINNMASFDTFMALRDFVKGKISRYELEDSDPDIYHVSVDNSNRGLSVVKLRFNDDKFWKSVGLHEDDIWFMGMINSNYSGYEFMDWYSVKDEFVNGYTVFGELNEDNIEKLKLISRLIYPKKFDLENEQFRVDFANKLINTFKVEIEDILSDYLSEKNSEMTQVAQESIEKELNDYFKEAGFTYVSDDEFTTTVGNLVMWYIRENSLQLPIEELLPKIFASNKINVGGWQEDTYEYQDAEKFDSVSFNLSVERNLDKIIEKIEDGSLSDGEFNMQDYLGMVDRISKKFEIGKRYDLPKKKDVRFYIENFEMNPNKIVVKLSKGMKQTILKLTEENFYHLLYQPTLFNLEEI
jgi:hypothetical protein